MTEPALMGLKAHVRTQTVEEREAAGREARKARPRTSLAEFTPAAGRPDPVALLASQEDVRVPALLPLRHQRMSVSPFTFYRGSAVVMANDLASMPNSGLIAQICGDAHLSNFGMFAAPDRDLVFDINDFDETNPGPFEWDVMRLAASFVLAGRDVNISEEAIANAATAVGFSYRTQMATYATMPDIEIWYDRVSVETLQQWAKQERIAGADKRLQVGAAKARARDSWSAISKMTEVVNGKRQFKELPPLLMRVPLDTEGFSIVKTIFGEYRDTLAPDRSQLMRRYKIIDPANFNESSLLAYAIACGRTMARAHARAGDPVAINAYLGTSAKFDKAVKDFSLAYSKQVVEDFHAYQAAIADGRVVVAAPGEGEHYKIVASTSAGLEVVTDDGSSPGVPATS